MWISIGSIGRYLERISLKFLWMLICASICAFPLKGTYWLAERCGAGVWPVKTVIFLVWLYPTILVCTIYAVTSLHDEPYLKTLLRMGWAHLRR